MSETIPLLSSSHFKAAVPSNHISSDWLLLVSERLEQPAETGDFGPQGLFAYKLTSQIKTLAIFKMARCYYKMMLCYLYHKEKHNRSTEYTYAHYTSFDFRLLFRLLSKNKARTPLCSTSK